MRQRVRWAAAGLVAVLAVGASGYAGWQAWQNRCQAAAPELDSGAASPAIAPAQLGEHWPPEDVAIATGAPEPFGAPRFAVPGIKTFTEPELIGDGTLLLREGRNGEIVRAVDSGSGRTRWQRQPRGRADQPAVPVADLVALVADPFDEELTVVTVDRAGGAVRSCVRLDGNSQAPAVVAPAGEGLLAVTRGGSPDGPLLSLVDPRAGTVTAEAPIELLPRDLRSAGDVVVASTVPADHSDGWRLLVVASDQPPVGELLLRAYSAADAAPAWEYAFDPGDGGRQFAHQLVATGDDLVLVIASRFHPWDGWHVSVESDSAVESHLVALDPATGRQRWARELPPGPTYLQPAARRYGDTVLVRADRPGDLPRLVGYDVATGAERWRPDISVNQMWADGAHLAAEATALVPARTGLVAVDLADGGTRMLFDGLTAFQAVADDTTVGVVLGLGDAMLVLYDRR